MEPNIAFEIEWRKLLITKLSRALTALNKSAAAEKEATITRQAEIRELYPTKEEAHEAFGYGYITEEEWRSIAEQLESVNAPTITSAARDELRDILSRLRKDIRDLEWEAMPEADRERVRQNIAKHKDKRRAVTIC
ncbi:MAG: hypothetical protein A4E56_02247 [Pelotomaculum sp. PtaU1.Bin065]|nr:MAG: hypothetical protein A4E56_02247 [Pelotomaculum sp. PtaU1.Bin065]